MKTSRFASFGIVMAMLMAGCAHQQKDSAWAPATPKLKILNGQIKANPADAQAYSNRGYVLALLGQKEAARADLQKAVSLKDNGPMHNRVGWAYFNMEAYADSVREFET